jgi:hypothetical protein
MWQPGSADPADIAEPGVILAHSWPCPSAAVCGLKCNWKRRRSSAVVVSGERFKNPANSLQLYM